MGVWGGADGVDECFGGGRLVESGVDGGVMCLVLELLGFLLDSLELRDLVSFFQGGVLAIGDGFV